jgi:FMN reductase
VTYQRIVGVAGNFHRPSKTRRLVEAIGARVARTPQVDFAIYDLIDFGPSLGGALSRAELPLSTKSILRRIEAADALIVGTPVYKGAYTGLFKHLFDLVDPAALRNVPVVLTATGADRVMPSLSSTTCGRSSASSRRLPSRPPYMLAKPTSQTATS